jgi:hypothetical protein
MSIADGGLVRKSGRNLAKSRHDFKDVNGGKRRSFKEKVET